MEDLARNYIASARDLASNSCYSKAFELYIMAFECCPELGHLFEPEFCSVLARISRITVSDDELEKIFNNFGRVVNIFPRNYHLLNNIGKCLYKYGYFMEAWSYFRKALKEDPGLVDAEKNLNSLKNFFVERWHFRMINDKTRNDAYRAAIHKVITKKDTVLDLGSGTGLLALYAYECKPIAITAVDSSITMTKLSEDIMTEHNIIDIVVVNKMSTEMNFMDIGGKRSVLITELFDAGLFGEHILLSLLHAYKNLLNKEPKVLPNRAEFFVVGAKCDSLHNKYQLKQSIKDTLKIAGVNVHVNTYNETYDCEDVYLYKDLIYATEAQSLVQIDFNDYNDIKEKINLTEPMEIKLPAKINGEVNTIIGWFNLHLTENITLTTNPQSDRRSNAWQQAIFYEFLPKKLKENESLDLNFFMNSGKLTLNINDETRFVKISAEMLRFLNDTAMMKIITDILGIASVYLGQLANMTDMNIADLNPFPFFGLLMMKRGVKSLLCYAKNEVDKEFIKMVFEANDIEWSRVTVVLGSDMTQHLFGNKKYHAIFFLIFELCGDVDLIMRTISRQLRTFNLVPGGLYMPSKISLMCQLVNSHWLDINNRIYDNNITNYKMADNVNGYQVSQNFCLDLQVLDYDPLTEPFCLGVYNSSLRSDVVNVPVIKDGNANAVLCWYSIELVKDMGEISTNIKGSFIDCMAFIANPEVRVIAGEEANVLRCIDSDGAFKLLIDTDFDS